MSAYEDLVERAARKAIVGQMHGGKPLWVLLADCNKTAEDLHGPIRAAMAEILRTLQEATPEMATPELAVEYGEAWLAMLRASPLVPPEA